MRHAPAFPSAGGLWDTVLGASRVQTPLLCCKGILDQWNMIFETEFLMLDFASHESHAADRVAAHTDCKTSYGRS